MSATFQPTNNTSLDTVETDIHLSKPKSMRLLWSLYDRLLSLNFLFTYCVQQLYSHAAKPFHSRWPRGPLLNAYEK